MGYVSGPYSEEEFNIILQSSLQVRREYSKEWLSKRGYEDVPNDKIPIRVMVERNKYIEYIMGTEEARKKVAELIEQKKNSNL